MCSKNTPLENPETSSENALELFTTLKASTDKNAILVFAKDLGHLWLGYIRIMLIS